MNRSNLVVAAAFLALGLYLTISAASLPTGIGGVPGAGFFPYVIGAVMTVLAAALGFAAIRETGGDSFVIENGKPLFIVIGLTAAYLALWGTGWFALRSLVFLALLMRFAGQGWKPSLTVATLISVAATLAFRYGFRVSLE